VGVIRWLSPPANFKRASGTGAVESAKLSPNITLAQREVTYAAFARSALRPVAIPFARDDIAMLWTRLLSNLVGIGPSNERAKHVHGRRTITSYDRSADPLPERAFLVSMLSRLFSAPAAVPQPTDLGGDQKQKPRDPREKAEPRDNHSIRNAAEPCQQKAKVIRLEHQPAQTRTLV
jgi:hypothetical protein